MPGIVVDLDLDVAPERLAVGGAGLATNVGILRCPDDERGATDPAEVPSLAGQDPLGHRAVEAQDRALGSSSSSPHARATNSSGTPPTFDRRRLRLKTKRVVVAMNSSPSTGARQMRANLCQR
jgi:hypothetical protein